MSDVIRLNQFELKILEEYRQYKIKIFEDMVNAGNDFAKGDLEMYKRADMHDLLTRCIFTSLTQSKEYCERHNLV